jgi:hypothetical protein
MSKETKFLQETWFLKIYLRKYFNEQIQLAVDYFIRGVGSTMRLPSQPQP